MTATQTNLNSGKLAAAMRYTLLVSFLFSAQLAMSQDMEYARQVLNQLCSDELAGRGYVEDGDNAAAYYIEQLSSLSTSHFAACGGTGSDRMAGRRLQRRWKRTNP